jgi:hypothetical protein
MSAGRQRFCDWFIATVSSSNPFYGSINLLNFFAGEIVCRDRQQDSKLEQIESQKEHCFMMNLSKRGSLAGAQAKMAFFTGAMH